MTEPTAPNDVPPYISFATLLNQLERMEREGVPARIDASYLTGMAGGTRSQFRVGMRSLGLIDAEDRATDTLVRLAKNPDQRPEILAGILRSRYPGLVALNGNATRGQLEEVMVNSGLASVDTRRKAMAFYVSAASYAGITLSPHLKPTKPGGSSTAGASRRTRSAKKRSPAPPTPPAPPSQVAEQSEMRRAYFDLLLEQAKQAADDKDVLDRIERLIDASLEAELGIRP